MTACPTDGRLRAAVDLDDPAVAAHVRDCRECAARERVLRDDAATAAQAIGALDDGAPPLAPAAVEVALRSVSTRTRGAPAAVAVGGRRRTPLTAVAGVVALLVALALVATPMGREAAADFLAGFRAERLQVVTIDTTQPADQLDRLEDVATVELAGDGDPQLEPRDVGDRSAAAAVAGFAPAQVTALPDGIVAGETMAAPPRTARITFDAASAPDLPAELDGAALVVSMPGVVVTRYAGPDGGELMVGEAGQLAVDAEGGDLADIRDYLLDRPEVPDDLARQLLAIDDWTTTLPVPVPVDEVAWQETTVAGQPGLALDDGLASGLLWQRDGHVLAVGGTGVDASQVREIADGLR